MTPDNAQRRSDALSALGGMTGERATRFALWCSEVASLQAVEKRKQITASFINMRLRRFRVRVQCEEMPGYDEWIVWARSVSDIRVWAARELLTIAPRGGVRETPRELYRYADFFVLSEPRTIVRPVRPAPEPEPEPTPAPAAPVEPEPVFAPVFDASTMLGGPDMLGSAIRQFGALFWPHAS